MRIGAVFAVFLLGCFNALSQEILIKSFEGNPIPFATVQFIKNDSIVGGTYGNQEGIAKLDVPTGIDEIVISHLGFNDTLINTASIPKVITLYEAVNNIPEVFISNKRHKEIWVDNDQKGKKIYMSAQRGIEIATFIPNESHLENYHLKSFEFRVKRRSEKLTAKLKINFFENEAGKPGAAIENHEAIMVTLDSKVKGDIQVSLQDYDIRFPENGIFIGIEWLGLVNEEGDLLETNIYYDSSIKYVIAKEENKEVFSFVRNRFKGDTWFKHFIQDKSVAPSFSLELY